MAKRKLKKKVKIVFGLFIVAVLGLILGIKAIKTYQYHQTYEYKLLEKNYTLNETKILIKKLSSKELEEILKAKYNNKIASFVKEKYFLYKNLNRYLAYKDKNDTETDENVIALVNVNRDKDYYTDIVETNTNLKEAMLVNKYHALNKTYEAPSIVKISSSYAYADNELNEDAYNAFRELANNAKTAGYTILILSSYRPYADQEKIWNDRKATYGIRKADQYAARAGSSEHETGYAIDVADYNDKNDEFGKTESYKWMINNSYKYGYILRYPEKKENITGYAYEPWHYRYVGKELANKVYNSGLTFDEYYEFYLNDSK
jgi:LAS superfamily LD-carboxypeptidase LdcB